MHNLARTPKIKVTKNRAAYSSSLPELTKIYNQFYSGNNKTIPDRLEFDPLILAIWFMDDGSRSRNDLYLNTQKFSIKDQLKLISMLKTQHGIKLD